MPGILLDTHAFYWTVTQAQTLSDDALIDISAAQAVNSLFVSPITAWELSVATQKPPHKNPLRLTAPPGQWFRSAVRASSTKIVPIGVKIAIAAAEAPVATGHKDPGDCYLIATSRVQKIPLVTRDASIIRLADRGYLHVIVC